MSAGTYVALKSVHPFPCLPSLHLSFPLPFLFLFPPSSVLPLVSKVSSLKRFSRLSSILEVENYCTPTTHTAAWPGHWPYCTAHST